MYSTSEKTVKVNIISTSLNTLKGKSLVMPESKGKYDLEKVIDGLKHQVPFVDKGLYAILIRAFNEKVIDLASQGYQVDTELVRIRPVVTGTVPRERTTLKNNKLKIVTTPCKELRTCISKTKLRVARHSYPNRYITEASNAFEPKMPIFEQGYVQLRGSNLKIMGDFAQCGIWLENNVTKQRFKTHPMGTYNKPKSLIFKLPDELSAGSYTISIVTCYCGTKRLLAKPRLQPVCISLTVCSSSTTL